MSLRFAILAALLDGEASGYDLAKRFDVSVANFWSTTPQQLYRELDRMHVDELIAAEIVEQSKRPNKRVFALTRAGRDALQEFSAQPTRPVVIRDELLVKVQALNASAPQDVHKSLVERAALAKQKARPLPATAITPSGRAHRGGTPSHDRKSRALPHAHGRHCTRTRVPRLGRGCAANTRGTLRPVDLRWVRQSFHAVSRTPLPAGVDRRRAGARS